MSDRANYSNGLLSEKEAARWLGISRITLLRTRQAGRIGFYRIGTRVLFEERHLREFLARVERHQKKSTAEQR